MASPPFYGLREAESPTRGPCSRRCEQEKLTRALTPGPCSFYSARFLRLDPHMDPSGRTKVFKNPTDHTPVHLEWLRALDKTAHRQRGSPLARMLIPDAPLIRQGYAAGEGALRFALRSALPECQPSPAKARVTRDLARLLSPSGITCIFYPLPYSSLKLDSAHSVGTCVTPG